MIEFCSKKRMLAGVIFLGGLTLIVLIFESQWAFEASSVNHQHTNYSLYVKNDTPEFCWVKDKFKITEPCHLCTDFEIASKSNKACVDTHFKEGVQCENFDLIVYRSCDRVHWLEEKKFWQFEAFVLVLALTSTCCVVLRQKVLDHRHLKQLQRRFANCV